MDSSNDVYRCRGHLLVHKVAGGQLQKVYVRPSADYWVNGITTGQILLRPIPCTYSLALPAPADVSLTLGGIIAGKVTNGSDVAVAGVRASAYDPVRRLLIGTYAYSDSAGNYAIRGLPHRGTRSCLRPPGVAST